MSETLDRRLNAYRDDLADRRFEGRVDARKFVDATPAFVTAPFADLKAGPSDTSGLDTQVLSGHGCKVFEKGDEWSWVQADYDGYVGYTRTENLTFGVFEPSHHVLAPRTFRYSKPDLKSPRVGYLSMGSFVKIVERQETRGTQYCQLSDSSWVIENHLIGKNDFQSDPVAIAETLLHAPYLWGGTTGFGIDCAGLVQVSHMLCGNAVLRDSDMQAASIGTVLENDPSALQRGDLVFWKGHVGMMADGENLLHANGHTMNVALEPLADAIERIGYLYGQPTAYRRP